MPAEGRRCPPWCAGAHSLSDEHTSAVTLGAGWLCAVTCQRAGGPRGVRVAGVAVYDAGAAGRLARLIGRLADATPAEHRELEEQVWAAAAAAFGGEATERARDAAKAVPDQAEDGDGAS